ncbi:phosphotransferase family protein [Deinococcus arboris]|nr:aminoglycoside phosphotransferase family protein [Deinococcus arboris]
MPALPDLSATELQAFAERYGLDSPLTRLPSRGIVNRVYLARRAGQPVVLRVPMPGDDEDTLTESVAVPAAVRTGVNTPDLLIFDNSRAVLDAPVTVYALAPGQSLDSCGWAHGDPRLRRAWQAAGRALARLHAGVSSVDDPQGLLEVITPPDTAQVMVRVLDGGHLSRAEARWTADTVDRLLRETSPPLQPAFLHNDLHPGNLMVTEGGAVTALIDWGDAGWGDPALDLCYGGPLAAPDLWRGYEDEAPGVLGEAAPLRLLAYLLHDATRRLARAPDAHGHGDLWYTRPGTALMQLLRVSPQFPDWAEVFCR